MRTKIIILLYFISLMLLTNCNNSLNSPEEIDYYAPSKDLTLNEIFKYQEIKSIHFLVFDSTSVNYETNSTFKLGYEIFCDQKRLKVIHYFNNNPWIISVEDLNKNISWKYYIDLNYLESKNEVNQTSLENTIKTYLCTHLKENIKYDGEDIISDEHCAVYEDENQTIEWVTKKNKIPIQFKRFMSYDNLYQITTIQLRNVDLNVEFQDSIFEIPKL